VIASVHVADVGARSALAVLRKAPKPGSTAGLRHANVALTAPLSGSVLPSPSFGRVGLIAFWDGETALDGFLRDHPMAATLAADGTSGWSRCAPSAPGPGSRATSRRPGLSSTRVELLCSPSADSGSPRRCASFGQAHEPRGESSRHPG
jgi:hypothetical protein